jgi:hypothetical protein
VSVNGITRILAQDCKNLVRIQLVAEDVEDVGKTFLLDAERDSTLNTLRDDINFVLCDDHSSSCVSNQNTAICMAWQAIFIKKCKSLKINDLRGAAGRVGTSHC